VDVDVDVALLGDLRRGYCVNLKWRVRKRAEEILWSIEYKVFHEGYIMEDNQNIKIRHYICGVATKIFYNLLSWPCDTNI